ncbi:hypothetical protein T265_08593 [Opisthorchis viverrini]|uniref:G-protein coupled receptors family 1 profile domain-containing protein n=1 Tax=Opisthorchis viverrini TaxID=6198 RepID=A0A074Z8L1_OPIVI|nr:hypothetical protein T265_08593 [Opisthorchis viverrini]KER23551.1 hypothetical protein T265_08593 [Opisthorchis viverrini]
MNLTGFGCDVFEKQYMTISGAIASSVTLSLLGILGTCGNILVIVVYCVQPRSTNRYIVITSNAETHALPNLVNQQSFSPLDPIRKRQRNFTQTRLILVLAVVDLLTCVIVLPWDVIRPIKFILTSNQTSWQSYDQWFLTRTLINFSLEAPLMLLRNVAFAGEGSILAAIAVERFLALVPTPRTPCQRIKRSSSSASNADQGKIFRPEEKDEEEQISKKGPKMRNEVQQKSSWHSNCCSPLCLGANCVTERCNQQLYIWGIIVTVCLSVLILELIIFLLQAQQTMCNLAGWMREISDRIYVLLTLVSCIFICYLYLSVFLVVHQTDLRKHRWKKRTHHNLGSTEVARTSTALKTACKGTYDSEGRVSGQQGTQFPSEISQRCKNVSFATTEQSHFADGESLLDESAISFVSPESQINSNALPSLTSRAKSASSFLRSRRTGLMLFTSTVVFYATLFPVLWVHFRWWSEDEKSSHKSEGSIINRERYSKSVVHHEFYYVNNAVNVFIYSLLSGRFRERVKLLFQGMLHFEQVSHQSKDRLSQYSKENNSRDSQTS